MIKGNQTQQLPQVLLPKIAELWDTLHVPLLYRSRFFLAFRGRETFYFEAEHRRLTWLRSETGSPDDGSPEAARAAQRRLGRAHRMLDVRFWIPRSLKLWLVDFWALWGGSRPQNPVVMGPQTKITPDSVISKAAKA
jgi:hypothetical protein